MDDPPNRRPYDQPNPEPQYQHPSGQYQQQYQQPTGQYQQPSGQYQQPSEPQYPEPQQPPPPPPRKCEEPQPPADPCTPTPPEPCMVQPFKDRITELEQQTNQQEKDTAKGELAAFQKLSDEVWKAEKDYAKDFDSLVFREAGSEAFYNKVRSDLLNGRISDSERKRIAEIVYCRPDINDLLNAWISARNMIPDLQRDLTKRQMEFSDIDEIYKAARTKYQDAQKALDTLQDQTQKEFNARNYRGAWYLNEFEMCPGLNPPPRPCDFNDELQEIAREHVRRSEELRKAKIALDQKTAESQKKKKDFEDAKAKRREDILKAIANDPFPVEPKPSPQPTSPQKPSNYQSMSA